MPNDEDDSDGVLIVSAWNWTARRGTSLGYRLSRKADGRTPTWRRNVAEKWLVS